MSKRETTLFALILVLVSVALYGVNYWAFGRPGDMAFYTVLDLGFLPLQVLLLYLVIDRLLAHRERQSRHHKLNMVIGTFFSAFGRPLLRLLNPMVSNGDEVAAHSGVDSEWDEARLREALRWVEGARFQLEADGERLAPLRDFLAQGRDFLVRLLENPTLLEHERFTDLLWAVSHLQEELAARESLEGLPAADLAHLAADGERAYGRLLAQWLEYMIHLKRYYPYLYSFAARTCPLREGARAEIE